MTIETETLDEFKARVYKVGKAAAVEHDWCGVFDELMDELGIEQPRVGWPKPGTLFRVPNVWLGDTIAIILPDQKYRFVRDCGQPDTDTTTWPLDDLGDVSKLVVLDV